MSSKPHTVIVGHGHFPQGLLEAAQGIVGAADEGVITISNQGLGLDDLVKRLQTGLDSDTQEVFIFVDLVGGSCFNACRTALVGHPNWVLISGVNLPMIITYLSYRGRLEGEELIGKVLQAGRRGLARFD